MVNRLLPPRAVALRANSARLAFASDRLSKSSANDCGQAVGKRLDGAPIEAVIAAKIVEATAESGIRDRYLAPTAPA
jgi:hypothetical protein